MIKNNKTPFLKQMNKKILLACGAALLLILFIGCTGLTCDDPICQDIEDITKMDTQCPPNCNIKNCDFDEDGIVNPKEKLLCEQTTKPSCGDGTCDTKLGEDLKSCPQDCSKSSCNYNDVCDASENILTCIYDCADPIRPPQSPVIKSVSVEGKPIPVISNGDLWYSTWASSGSLYTTWGDGSGFSFELGPKPGAFIKYDMGVAKIRGEVPNISGINLYTDDIQYFDYENMVDDKPSSILSIDGIIYGQFHSPLGDSDLGYLAVSEDYGITWIRYKETSPWTKRVNSNFRSMFFINMGKNYELNTDGYVYAFGMGREWDWDEQLYLARVKKEKIMDYSAYEYFKGMTSRTPTWTKLQSDASPIHQDMIIGAQVSAIYHPGVDRYLIMSSTAVYDAPNPWGPWTYAGKWIEKDWYGYMPGIIPKDTGANDFWFTISGQPQLGFDVDYNMHLGKITMELNNTSTLWGRLANAGNKGDKIATTLYFPGVPTDESTYTANPLSNEKEFDIEDIDTQLDRMKSIGINSVQISYWGKNLSDGTMAYQMNADNECIVNNICVRDKTTIGDVSVAYSRLIRQIEQKEMLFSPFIEVSAAFNFLDFPNNIDNMADRISWFIENSGDTSSWTEVYDKTGEPRKLVSLIGTFKLNRLTPEEFADGFEDVAEQIYVKHGIKIGFSIDPQRFVNAPDVDRVPAQPPIPEELESSNYILGVAPYYYSSGDGSIEGEVRDTISFLAPWRDAGYPVVTVVTPGYDGSRVFPDAPVHGRTYEWREAQKQLAVPSLGTAGISIGPWNGWTEYYHTTCSIEEGATNLKWAKEIIDISNGRTPDSSGVTCPSTQAKFCGDGICNEHRDTCPLDCNHFGTPNYCGTEIPYSPVINSVSLESMTPTYVTNYSEGDIWRMTVAKDGSTYTAWGDGGGFSNKPFVIPHDVKTHPNFYYLGVGKLTGTFPNNLTGENLYVSDTWQGPNGSDDKPYSLLAIEDTLYLTACKINADAFCYLGYSTDGGNTFTMNKDTVDQTPEFEFINMGQNYELNTDGYVYVSTVNVGNQIRGALYLARVPIKQILNVSAYEYYSSENSNNPTWNAKSSNAKPILPTGGVYNVMNGITYHPGTQRFILMTEINVYDAPNPWGPWTCAGTWLTPETSESWQGGYYPYVVPIESEENSFYFTYAGQGDPWGNYMKYRFNLGKITMEMK
jgi:hypothetical protein